MHVPCIVIFLYMLLGILLYTLAINTQDRGRNQGCGGVQDALLLLALSPSLYIEPSLVSILLLPRLKWNGEQTCQHCEGYMWL